ncbi:helix-turn-helix transcriptional regulator [Clostridium perfringens]|uniref:helix-turn-helix domain-containing protein n=1 Tax=Clostridium perfringens TaxID=1502 RepID=UPI0028E0E211|nr:helix-turn-helix transcriptional regulator [Clostridium perfringens]MDT9337820.1 helix-turn-helix transcriptional regulator [Clostridium perfringens]MDT9345577.1 helix-turn-helix transcriptional regulator [Clostridium perfringens]MDT9347013.1 helix-turn-helix transcriptional regulator [Clostridium perfringens]MDT9354663.1 helix-turn-helix transcriptional regulator [Clostridium perfringens]
MNERFKLIRKKEKLSQAAFGEKLGVSRDVIGNIEYGRVDPKPLLINHLCDVFNVNKEWLLTGNGEMYIVPEKENEIADLLINISSDDSKLYEVVSNLSKLDDEYLDLIDNLVSGLLKKQREQDN